MIENSSFERGTNYWSLTSITDADGIVSDGNNGNGFKIQNDSYRSKEIYQTIPVKGNVNDTYIASVKLKTKSCALINGVRCDITLGVCYTDGTVRYNTVAANTASTQTTTTGTTNTSEEYFDRAMAEQVFAMVNAERSAAGIPELTWSEDLYNIAMERCHENDGHAGVRPGTGENCQTGAFGDDNANATTIHQNWKNSQGHYDNYMNTMYGTGAVAILRMPGNLGGIQLGDGVVAYEVFGVGSTATNSSVTINTPVQDNSVAAAPKTADENTSASSSNVGWSMTPPTQEDGLKKWQEQNPDAEVSFGN